MSARENDFSAAALDDLAAEWLCERAEGFAPVRAQEFAAWCACDPRHAAAVARVERTLALLDEMPLVRAPLEARFRPSAELGASPARATLRRRAWRTGMIGLAAALVLAAIGSWNLVREEIGMITAKPPSGADHAPATRERCVAAAGRPERLELRDGSVVDLNTGSELLVEFTSGERRVTLAAGEAHFAVANDASRPFIVTAGGLSVRAVGTAFNVRLAPNAVDVLVVEGKVEVAGCNSPLTEPPRLSAGERTVVRRIERQSGAAAAAPTNIEIERIAPAAMRDLLAWQDRMTQFVDVPLREIAERFNRRNTLQLVVEDATLADRRIGGVVAWDQVEAFVRLLEQDGDMVGERRGPHEIVLRRAR